MFSKPNTALNAYSDIILVFYFFLIENDGNFYKKCKNSRSLTLKR